MKHATTSVTIEHLVELMRRSRVLPEAEVRAIEEGWPRETDDTADVGRFARWLVVCGHLTEYQTAMLLHGHASALFLGPYKLLDRIGKGSLAVVYRAVGPTGEVVALKVLPPSRARDHRLRAQFRNEAELACQLHHANVVHAVEAVLRQLLDRLLAKDPDARFTFPAEALAALSANVETMPAAASVLQSATVGPAEPIARIQLIPVVDVARPATAIPIAVPVEPKPTTTRLPAEDIASIPVSPTFDDERVRPPPRRWATSFWLAMLLGALILLLAQSAGWMLAYLLFP